VREQFGLISLSQQENDVVKCQRYDRAFIPGAVEIRLDAANTNGCLLNIRESLPRRDKSRALTGPVWHVDSAGSSRIVALRCIWTRP
jgi:hypothetical protein